MVNVRPVTNIIELVMIRNRVFKNNVLCDKNYLQLVYVSFVNHIKELKVMANLVEKMIVLF